MTENEIYDTVMTAMMTAYPGITAVGRFQRVPPSFPCIYMEEVDRSEPRQGWQLDAKDEQWDITYEVQVFGESSAECRKIMNSCNAEMRKLYFREITRYPVDDADHYRIVSRFRRLVGSGDK